jgi:hypothetical protein
MGLMIAVYGAWENTPLPSHSMHDAHDNGKMPEGIGRQNFFLRLVL